MLRVGNYLKKTLTPTINYFDTQQKICIRYSYEDFFSKYLTATRFGYVSVIETTSPTKSSFDPRRFFKMLNEVLGVAFLAFTFFSFFYPTCNYAFSIFSGVLLLGVQLSSKYFIKQVPFPEVKGQEDKNEENYDYNFNSIGLIVKIFSEILMNVANPYVACCGSLLLLTGFGADVRELFGNQPIADLLHKTSPEHQI